MALPPIINNPKWLFKVTEQQSKDPEMALCLLGFFLGSGMRTIELCRIQCGDVLTRSGRIKKKLKVRGEIERDFHILNSRLISFIEKYIAVRKKDGSHPDYFCGFDPEAAFFVRNQGAPFKIAMRSVGKGNSYTCPTLNNYIKKLLSEAGIESPSIESGRRTFALKLKRDVDKPTIHKMLGNRDIETTNKLLFKDPLTMQQIAEMAF